MNDEITKKVVDWLDNLASDQIPAFVQEVATYGFYSNLTYTLISIAVITFAIKIMRSIKDERDEAIGLGIGALIFLIVFSFVLVDSLMLTVKAAMAPKLYAIDHFRK